jgi:mono/diheme cytochrome c family protein
MNDVIRTSMLLGACFSVACGTSSGTPIERDPSEDASMGLSFAAQVEAGETSYAMHCAGCHGAELEGNPMAAPALAGRDNGALPHEPRPGSRRTIRFETVGDLADYVTMSMPPRMPGSLSSDEYWAVIALLLDRNGMARETAIDPEGAADLPIER